MASVSGASPVTTVNLPGRVDAGRFGSLARLGGGASARGGGNVRRASTSASNTGAWGTTSGSESGCRLKSAGWWIRSRCRGNGASSASARSMPATWARPTTATTEPVFATRSRRRWAITISRRRSVGVASGGDA